MSGQAPRGPESIDPVNLGPASPVEDGRSPVAGNARRELTAGTKLGILALMAILGLGFIWFNALFSHKHANEKTVASAAYANGGEVFRGMSLGMLK